MRFGVTIFATDQSMAVVELARAAEERGFDSLWIPEHTHIPTSRRTPPPTGDAELAEEYKRSVDPLVALAAAASVTDHDPPGHRRPAARPARAASSPPRRSPRCRTSPAAGSSWASASAGTRRDGGPRRRLPDPPGRTPASTCWPCRRCGATRWPTFDGEHVAFPPTLVVAEARPATCRSSSAAAPGPKMFAHIAEYGDGWIPIGGAGLASRSRAPRCASRHAGRDPDTLRIVPVRLASQPRQARALRSASA